MFLISLSFEIISQTETINSVPTLPDHTFSFATDLTKSTNYKGLPRLLYITPAQEDITYGSALPDGAWGQGYFSAATTNAYWDEDNYSDWYTGLGSCYPLVRDQSEMIRAHLHAYMLGESSTNLTYVKQGLNFLLDIQDSYGGFLLYKTRIDTGSPNFNANVDPYPTAHALRTMAECYMFFQNSGEYYSRIAELEDGIFAAESWFWNTGSPHYYSDSPFMYNSNNKGFALWALTESYKVTNNAISRDNTIALANVLIEEQVKTGLEKGIWLTGGPQTDAGGTATWWHDTHIQYISLILRGLIETLTLVEYDDEETYYELLDCIKRTINHIIQYRLYYDYHTGTPSGKNLRTLYLDEDKNLIPESWHDGEPSLYESIAALIYYSKYYDGFTTSEVVYLNSFLNYISQNLNSSELKYFNATAFYEHYSDVVTNDERMLHKHWSVGAYDMNDIDERIVTADFDNDGYNDDFAAIYDLGSGTSAMHVWKSNDHFSRFQGVNGWWKSGSGQYTADQTSGRVVSGDFDNDGYLDDVASMYDYGAGTSRIHVWTSNGSEMMYQGSSGWWASLPYQYDANQVAGRMVSGDFDNDGYHDDIATMFKYGPGSCRIHVWLGTGSGFTYQGSTGWWASGSYYSTDQISNRFVSGDFDSDGYHDDIAVMYDYGSGSTRIHLFKGQGSSFIKDNGNSGWWISPSYYSTSGVGNRFESGDFDNDGYHDDLVTMYDYGSENARLHVWRGYSSYFSYQGNTGWWQNTNSYSTSLVGDRLLVGDFNTVGRQTSVASFYDYTNSSYRLHVWQSTGMALSFTGPEGYWGVENANPSMAPLLLNTDDLDQMMKEKESNGISIYPNPGDGLFTISGLQKDADVYIYDELGRFVDKAKTENNSVDLQGRPKGIYYFQVANDAETKAYKVILK